MQKVVGSSPIIRSSKAPALGSTLALADSLGTVQTQYTYDAFGNATQSGSVGASYQFTGRENDQTGLQYNRSRYYSPATGRFITADPIGFAGGDVNLYAYGSSDPINLVDPMGTNVLAGDLPCPCQLQAAGAGFAAGWVARKAFHGSFPTGEGDSPAFPAPDAWAPDVTTPPDGFGDPFRLPALNGGKLTSQEEAIAKQLQHAIERALGRAGETP